MTVYVDHFQQNRHNRSGHARLIISVHFVVTQSRTMEASRREQTDSRREDVPAGRPDGCGRQAPDLMEPRGAQPAHKAVTGGVRGKLAMRLKLVGSSAATKKEYHHAESLPA